MKRSYYHNEIIKFTKTNVDEVLGILSSNNQFELTLQQLAAWKYQIKLLKEILTPYETGLIAFEYVIPRIGSRIDVVLIIENKVILLEFKVGESNYTPSGIEQVEDYALDLKNFHTESEHITLYPILVSTEAEIFNNAYELMKEGIYTPLYCNKETLEIEIHNIVNLNLSDVPIDHNKWFASGYRPTPTIIEAAQALYSGHDVKDISRNDASAKNITVTTKYIMNVIDASKKSKTKSICFVTGVPGAGKTLVGLNIANELHKYEAGSEEHAVFLSGNEPLVTVLKEALTRDSQAKLKQHCAKCKEDNINSKEDCKSCEMYTNKSALKRKTDSFIQMIHHFRNESLISDAPPSDKIVIFDEAQRAWKADKLRSFMKERGKLDFHMSEPEFLIDYLNRHKDWSTIICLVGGGQEIHDGEAGIIEWFYALNNHFKEWTVYVSSNIDEYEYVGDSSVKSLLSEVKQIVFSNDLHLSNSIRSFRSEDVSAFTKNLINGDVNKSKALYEKVIKKYPIVMTRDLEVAKNWVKQIANGSERYGIVASSGAKRLRSEGIIVPKDMEVDKWFLNGKDDVNASFFLEIAASEFKIQGLEIDYALVAWEADYRFDGEKFLYYDFKGSKWNHVNDESRRAYLKNSYRVLLTRARQGYIIYVPVGNAEDHTRNPKFYDGTYQYLKSIGIKEVNEIEIIKYKKNKKKANKATHRFEYLVKEEDMNMESLMKLKNKEFVFQCLSGLAITDSLKEEQFQRLTNKIFCKDKFDMNFPIIIEVNPSTINNAELYRDAAGNRRYYPDSITINNKTYIVCNDWYYGKTRDTRSKFVKWCLAFNQ